MKDPETRKLVGELEELIRQFKMTRMSDDDIRCVKLQEKLGIGLSLTESFQ